MERSQITRDQLIDPASLIKAAVEAGQNTLSHGQVSVADARRALIMGLWRVRQQERQQQERPVRQRSRSLPLRRRTPVSQQ